MSFWPSSTEPEGVLFVGRAQEKAPVFRTEKRRNPITGATYPWIVKTTAMVNHFYMYAVDDDFGPFFIKFCSYFPYNAKLCINGNEWAKRQAAKAGIGFEALDNGFAPATTRPACSASVTVSTRPASTGCCVNGWPGCLTPSPPRTAGPATATTSPSSKPSSP